MPLTPFHFGPAVLLGLLLLERVDFPTFVVANVIVDARATLVFLGIWSGPLHGWPHSYLGSALVATALGAVMVPLRPALDEELRELRIVQRSSARNIFLAAYLGTFLHVTIDAFHHPLQQPLLPLESNPLLGILSTFQVRVLTAACIVLCVPAYVARWSRSDRENGA